MKNQRLRSVMLSLISLAIIAAFVYYLYANADQYRQLLNVSVSGAIMLFLLSLTFPIFNGLQNIVLYRSLGADISYKNGFMLTAASTLANQLPISGGVISKGLYLKRRYNLSYTMFISSTLALFVCFVAVNGFIGLPILLYWLLVEKIVVTPVLWIAYGLMAACLLIFWLPLERIKLPEKLRNMSHQAVQGWVLISKNPVLLFQLIGLQALLMLLLAMRYWLAFHMLSQNVTLAQTLLFATASILTQAVSIAPGGLGVREGLVGGVASWLGFDAGVSVVAVGLDRLVSTIMVMIVGWSSMVILGKELSAGAVQPADEEAQDEGVANDLDSVGGIQKPS